MENYRRGVRRQANKSQSHFSNLMNVRYNTPYVSNYIRENKIEGLATTQAKVQAAEQKLDQVKQQLRDHDEEIKTMNAENESLYIFLFIF